MEKLPIKVIHSNKKDNNICKWRQQDRVHIHMPIKLNRVDLINNRIPNLQAVIFIPNLEHLANEAFYMFILLQTHQIIH